MGLKELGRNVVGGAGHVVSNIVKPLHVGNEEASRRARIHNEYNGAKKNNRHAGRHFQNILNEFGNEKSVALEYLVNNVGVKENEAKRVLHMVNRESGSLSELLRALGRGFTGKRDR